MKVKYSIEAILFAACSLMTITAIAGVWYQRYYIPSFSPPAPLIAPLYYLPGSPLLANSQVILKNETHQPMQLKGSIDTASMNVTVTPVDCTLTVPPGKTSTVNFSIQSPQAIEGDGTIGSFQYTLSCTLSGNQKITSSHRIPIQIAEKRVCPRATTPKVIDGDLNDWGPLSNQISRYDVQNGKSILSGTCAIFSTCYGDKFLYVAIKVTDEVITVTPGKQPWDQDGVEIRLCSLPDPARAYYHGNYDLYDPNILLIPLCPSLSGQVTHIPQEEEFHLPRGTQYACVALPGGYCAEVAIPIAYLNTLSGDEWNAFRLNIAIDDNNNKYALFQQSWWQPDWRSENTIIGSGTFFKGESLVTGKR